MPQIEASARVGIPQRASMIDITITFCNGVVFVHNHLVTRDAVEEYAEMLIDAIEPPDFPNIIGSPLLSERPAPHVRQVAMLLYSDNGEHIQMIDSGVFSCEHHG